MAFLIFVCYNWITHSSLRTPPGPMPLPLVGNIFSLNFSRMHLTFAKLAQLYGNIFKVSVLGQEIVVINDITMLRKALQGQEFVDVFSDRPDNFGAKYIMFDSDIVVGKVNRGVYTLRKLLHKGLKVFGEGVAKFEYQLNDELDRFVAELNKQLKKDIEICPLLKKSFSNWMSSLITGHGAEHCDSEIIWDFNDTLTSFMTRGRHTLLTQLPSLRFLA